ncbi:MAG TPA: hypothetical protein VL003_07665 [Pusillimonas sp.]|uniref:hypothetical protein n=1 Tax=Pusillimonas sp. TaxID=3040095 RepID=UPI002C9BA81C|nr:hypothetical protein [Pusillimonas sp.]HUH87917.1 hypothetical protein [Pusillimonas sp.]
MNTKTAAKWPFPPVKQPIQPRTGQPAAGAAKSGKAQKSGLTRGAMLADVCLVAIWGATIPGLMWLGVAGGF